jgi:hypothetical protein
MYLLLFLHYKFIYFFKILMILTLLIYMSFTKKICLGEMVVTRDVIGGSKFEF